MIIMHPEAGSKVLEKAQEVIPYIGCRKYYLTTLAEDDNQWWIGGGGGKSHASPLLSGIHIISRCVFLYTDAQGTACTNFSIFQKLQQMMT